jgi:hypothetical protein
MLIPCVMDYRYCNPLFWAAYEFPDLWSLDNSFVDDCMIDWKINNQVIHFNLCRQYDNTE